MRPRASVTVGLVAGLLEEAALREDFGDQEIPPEVWRAFDADDLLGLVHTPPDFRLQVAYAVH